MTQTKRSIFQTDFLLQGLRESIKKLNPFTLWRNVVMFIVEIGAVITTIITIMNILNHTSYGFNLQITLWLWVTVIFATFSEALAEIQGKARAESLRKTRSELHAKRVLANGTTQDVTSNSLRKDDVILINEGDIIPGDGKIIQGTALVDESVITGESAPVIREAGGDRSSVTG